MNQQQLEALQMVRKLMTANFDSWIISYRLTNEKLQSAAFQQWHGDITDVIGLTAVTHDKLIRICNDPAQTLKL